MGDRERTKTTVVLSTWRHSLAREPAPALLTAVLFTGHDGRATAHKESLYHPMAATLRQSGISMLPSRNLRPDQAAIRTLSLIESSIAAPAVP
jgi:hypothetical protein